MTDDVCWRAVSYAVDFVNVSTIGLESSPVAAALAGLRANEARYFKNKYDHVFTVEPAAKAKKASTWCTVSSKRSATSSSPRFRLRQRPSRSRTSDGPTYSTRTGSPSTSCTRSTDRSQASGRVQALRRDGGPSRTRLVQVRPTEVEAGRNDPRLVLRDQGRVLKPTRFPIRRRHQTRVEFCRCESVCPTRRHCVALSNRHRFCQVMPVRLVRHASLDEPTLRTTGRLDPRERYVVGCEVHPSLRRDGSTLRRSRSAARRRRTASRE